MFRRHLTLWLCAALLAACGTNSFAQFKVIRPFVRGPSEANSPLGTFSASGSVLYGTGSLGGANNYGAVFRINADGSGYTTLHSFTGGTDDGASPSGSLTQVGPTLYGVTPGGGSNGLGIIFMMATDGTGFTILHHFSGDDGAGPGGSLTLVGTSLYGVAEGGAEGGGTIFRIDLDGSAFTNLYSAPRWTPLNCSLTLSGSALYGTTSGGGAQGVGTVFRINLDGSGYTVLHNFAGYPVDGGQPGSSALAVVGSTLYGSTGAGGASNRGTIFRINNDGTGYKMLHAFSGSDGLAPNAPLVLRGSTLYGTTGGGASGVGCVFAINLDGTGYNILHPFETGTGDGYNPYCGLALVGSSFFGMTAVGGSGNAGTAFKINPDGTSYAVLHSFSVGTSDGSSPWGDLTLAPGSILYGVTRNGGDYDFGVVFRTRTDGTGYTNLHSFAAGGGAFPVGDLTLSSSLLYGTLSWGGPLVFKINSDGTGYTILDDGGGMVSLAGLILARKALYGTAGSGGPGNLGAVFKVNTDGSGFQVLHTFLGGMTDGGSPEGSLALVGSILYGTTSSGGGSNLGTLFRISIDGSGYRVLHVFSGSSSDGAVPTGALTPLGGMLFGTTSSGGGNGGGTVFGVNADGSGYTNLYAFAGGAVDGANPFGSLALAGTTLYGMTIGGGTRNSGTVFQLNTDGTGYRVRHFLAGGANDGASPKGSLTVSGSTLYGMTDAGGLYNSGVIFSLGTSPTADFNILSQPTNLTIIEGDSASFQVVAAANEPLAYQWFFNQTNVLAGATNATLAWVDAQAADAGGYSVLVRNVTGALTSTTATLTVLIPPSILSQPTNETVIAGTTAGFQVVASGSQPLSYQWFFNQTGLLAGAANATLTVPNAQSPNAGGYSVVVTNVAGAVTSSVAMLTVLPATPSVTWTNPAPITYGTALTTNQLNASAGVPGTFAYTPTNGSLLYTGTNALSVIFTPTSTADYSTVTDAVSLLVLPAPLTITASNATRLYGQTNPVFAGTITGLQNGDQISATFGCSAIPTSPPGVYPIMPALVSPGDLQTNYQVTLVDGTLTVLAVLSGPSVSITQPANGASFLAGATLTLVASASDPQGTVTKVEFFQGGTNLLGIATNAPYSVAWSNVASGSYVLTAQATDNRGLSSTSAAVSIVVTNPLPPGLAVSIVSPASLSSFCAGSNVLISVAATNATGVARVEFFTGGTTLLGTVTSSPYNLTWLAPRPGTYFLTAAATDGQGITATSAPVEVVVTEPGQCGQVAIVRGMVDPEVDVLRNYLLNDLSLSPQVFDQEGLDPQSLTGYKLVIWDGLGTNANPLASGTVDALYAAYTNGIALYLIGERLASAGTNLPPLEQSEWTALTHLSAPSGVGGDGMVTLKSSIAFNPITNGIFGTLTNFGYPARLDIATNVDPTTEVIGTSGAADVLLVYPGFEDDTGQTRLFTQGLRVSPPDDPGSTNGLRVLFDNAVYWLLEGNWCDLADMSMLVTNSPGSAQVGQLLTYDVQVSSGNSECPVLEAAVTNLLPARVQFVSAQSAQGTWRFDPVTREVTFFLGYVGLHAADLGLAVTVMPVAAGTLTNTFGFVLHGSRPVSNPVLTNITQVAQGPDLAPTLVIRFTPPAGYELQLTGVANVRYDVQASTNLKSWNTVTNALGPDWQATVGLNGSAGSSRLFYRATVAK